MNKETAHATHDLRQYSIAIRKSPDGSIVGTCFIIGKADSTYALTCYHVVKDVKVAYLWFPQIKLTVKATVLETQSIPTIDIAVLEITEPLPDNLSVLTVSSDTTYDCEFKGFGFRENSRGHWIEGKVKGQVPNPFDVPTITDECNLLQLTAQDAFPGMSGTPLVVKGTTNLVGMVVYRYETSRNLGRSLAYAHGLDTILRVLYTLVQDSLLPDVVRFSPSVRSRFARMAWLFKHKFQRDPFEYRESRRDERFEKYFFSVGDFDAIVGDPSAPKVSFVFGGPGMGKSSLRIAVANMLRLDHALPVVYEDFYPLKLRLDSQGALKFADHVERLVWETICTLESEISSDEALATKLKSAPVENRKRLWQTLVPFVENPTRFSNVVRYIRQEDVSVDISRDHQSDGRQTLRELCECICQVCGYSRLYFLVDPNEDLSRDWNRGWSILKALIEDRSALDIESNGGAFKFFLGNVFREEMHSIPWINTSFELMFEPLKWDDKSLKLMLQHRLRAFSNPERSSLGQLSEVVDLDDQIVLRAAKCPQTLVDLCSKLFDVHCRADKPSLLITKEEVSQLFSDFRKHAPLIIDGLRVDRESDRVEFKSTLRYNLHTRKLDERMAQEIAETICAFRNTDGGMLIVGLDDDGDPIGLEYDLQILGPNANHDTFERAFNNLLRTYLNLNSRLGLAPRFEEYRSRPIFVVSVDPCDEPTYVSIGNDLHFYVRSGPSSRRQDLRETVEYVRKRFPK